MPLRFTLFLLVIVISACSSNKPSNETPFINPTVKQADEPTGILKRRVVLLGDAGHSAIEPLQASLQVAVEQAQLSPEQTSVVMLGDNIYYFGFPEKEDGQQDYTDDQLEDISHLEAQLQIAKRSGAEIFVVPGNHDWYAEQVDSQAAYISNYANSHNIKASFVPHQLGQAPHPEIIHRAGISIVFLDSMWLIKAQEDQYQNAMNHLHDLLTEASQQHPDNIILVTAHHPIETMGPHNRYYTSSAYKTMIAAYELFAENDQDTDHPRYQRLIDGMELTLSRFDKVIYAAGHDHSLQIFKDSQDKAPQYRIVSGAANTSKISGVGTNENTQFALAHEGLMVLDVYDNGAVLKVFAINQAEPVHQQWLWRSKAQ